ncbi:uncharacterized protein THITE_2010369, partial [Thermothielavioides terrestris NRRL 8126]
PLHVTIRFSTALPDLHLDIPSPHQTTVVALKHLIRGPAQASLARLRFIHNGRILPDGSVLSAVLRAPPPPPISHHADPKGKAPVGVHPHRQQRVFINCSIGDALPAADLAAEAAAAAAPPPQPPSLTSVAPSREPSTTTTTTTTTTAPPPLGFDRLLQAGLTPAEVATLRSHFRAIHTARFTPDTMPSPDALRAMEDAWLDNDSSAAPPPSHHVGGDAFGLSAVAGPLIRGMFIGFVFPLGVVGWLGKEDGLWSRRMQVFVAFGVLLSLSVGVVRALTGE